MSNDSNDKPKRPLLGPVFTAGPATVANSGDAAHPDAPARLPRADAPTQTPAAERYEYSFSVVVSRDSETGDIEITPFHCGRMAASVRFPDSSITIEPNGNFTFPWRFVNRQGQQLWVTTKELHHVLDELKRYTAENEPLVASYDA